MRAKTVFLIFSIAVILLSGSISQSAFADGTIDQNNLGKPLSAFPSIPPEPGNPRFGQIFTPIAPRLDAVEIEIRTLSLTGKQDFTIKVHQGNTFGMPTSELGTAILPAKGECIPSCVIHIDLLTHIPLVPGEPHILEIVPAISGMSWFFANAFNPYPGGDVIVNNFPQPSVDLIFATLFLQPGEVDTTPPEITASLEPICGEDDEGLFTVQFSATDDSGVESITATLNGITVTNGQTVKLELDDDLVVTASDSKGNSDTLSVIPSFSDLQVCKDEEDDNDEMGGDGSDSGGSGSDSGGSGSDSGGSGSDSGGSSSDSGGSGSGNDSQDDFSEGSDGSN